MFDQHEIQRAVEMQHRSYQLLKWMASAVKEGFVDFDVAHSYSSLPEAAEGWILGHYLNIPSNARPSRDDLPSFCAFFSTYLTNSFDLVANAGNQRYSPKSHCYCQMCSWLVEAPNLKAKKIRPPDKRRAEKMKANALASIAAGNELDRNKIDFSELLADSGNAKDACLVAYGYDLLQRIEGIANGPPVLVLWRGFAWTPFGSPMQGFRLRADSIIKSEKRLLNLMVQTIDGGKR